MEIRIYENGGEHFIETLAKAFKCTFNQNCQEYIMEVPERLGQGAVTAFDFDNGLSLIYFDCFFTEELEPIFMKGKPHPIHFNFCVKGEMSHQICDDQITSQLMPLTGSVSANPANCDQHFRFPPNLQLEHASLQIYRSEYLKKIDCDLEKMHEKLEGVFRDEKAEKSFLHEFNYNLPTAECICQIAGNSHESLVRSSYMEAKSLELLALQLKQFEEDHDPETRYVTLKRYDLDKILKARDLLVKDLQNAPTIRDLARKSGINQQKLKRGFKQVFGKTINQYLRETRLEKAKCLLLDGGSSVQDAAESVGYSNNGHFARKFRERYGLLPKDALQANSLKIDLTGMSERE